MTNAVEQMNARLPLADRVNCYARYLPHRFGPAPSHNFTIVREGLLRALNEASLCRQLTIIQGPAGSGKTSLLAQWVNRLRPAGGTPVWLTLEQSDSDPLVMTTGIAEACVLAKLDQLGEAIYATLPSLVHMSQDQVARTIAALINGSGAKLILIFDRYELADTQQLGGYVAALAEHCVGLHITIASRHRPNMSLGDLRARNQLFELTPTQLNFSPEETAAVLDRALPELYAHRLHAKTDAAPIVIQFARRAIDELELGATRACWRDWLNEYYAAELLDRFSAEVRETVARLMVVERFDLSLARTLAGPRAAQVIERLHRVEGILLREPYGDEYHFPEILRCLFADRLLDFDGSERAGLHVRAADWFAHRSRYCEALFHATKAGEHDRALALLERVGGNSVVMKRGVVGARDLLDSMDLAGFDAEPMAHLSFAMLLAHEGRLDQARTIVESARDFIAADNDAIPSDIRRQLTIIDAFLAGFADEPADTCREAEVREILETSGPSDHDERAQACTLLSWLNYQRGNLAEAETLIDAAMNEYACSEGEYGLLFTHIHRVLIRFWRNDLEGAQSDSALAVKLARLFFPEDQRLHVLTEILHSAILFEGGPGDRSIDLVNLLGIAGGVEAWSEIQIWAHRFAFRSALSASRVEEARAVCSNAREVAARLGTPRLDWNARCLRIDLEMAQGGYDQARSEAEEIGLLDASFLNRSELGWQERIAGAIAVAKLVALDDPEHARQMLDAAWKELEATPIPRLQAMVHLAETALCPPEDSATASKHLRDARACFPGLPSVRLFGNPAADPGSSFKPATVTAKTGSDTEADGRNPLTLRERQILEFMGEGHPNKVAAYRLGLSEATIKFHLRNIYRKLSARNRTQALAHYRRYGRSAN